MPTTYSLPDADDFGLLAAAMRRWHRPFADCGVRVGLLMARNAAGPAVKHAGYPALALIKVVPLKDRVRKGVDVEITIDAHIWAGLLSEEKLAVFDHELSHLELAKINGLNDDGSFRVATDDLGRPKLRTRPADWNAGDGFDEVVHRHGNLAAELRNVTSCYTRAILAREGQFADPPATVPYRDPAEVDDDGPPAEEVA